MKVFSKVQWTWNGEYLLIVSSIMADLVQHTEKEEVGRAHAEGEREWRGDGKFRI